MMIWNHLVNSNNAKNCEPRKEGNFINFISLELFITVLGIPT
jgi:hypothetical protein